MRGTTKMERNVGRELSTMQTIQFLTKESFKMTFLMEEDMYTIKMEISWSALGSGGSILLQSANQVSDAISLNRPHH